MSAAERWKPQVGAGGLLPLGRNWGALLDVTTSAAEAVPDGGGFVTERRIALIPSIVRLWRRQRYSIYAGGGWAYEHERQHSRIRPVVGWEPDGRPILSGTFVESRASSTNAMLALRAGAIVNLTQRIVLRTGFSFLPRYVDEDASKSVEFGLGWRF